MRPIGSTATDDITTAASLASQAPDFANLDDRTLLAMVIGGNSQDPDEIARRLLARFGDLGAVAWADLTELARAAQTRPEVVHGLLAVREFAVRLARDATSRRPVIASWSELLAYVRTTMAHRPREQFRVLFLDHRNHLMQDETIAEGTVDHAPVYVSRVIECFLALSAGRSAGSARQCASREPV